MLATSLPRISCTHQFLDILLICHDTNLPGATSSVRSTSIPPPKIVGYFKKYPRCEFSQDKGCLGDGQNALTLRMRTKRSFQITNHPFSTDPLIAMRFQGEMFKVRSPIRNFLNKREVVLYRTDVFVKYDFKGSE
jgi:hypothetical protein